MSISFITTGSFLMNHSTRAFSQAQAILGLGRRKQQNAYPRRWVQSRSEDHGDKQPVFYGGLQSSGLDKSTSREDVQAGRSFPTFLGNLLVDFLLSLSTSRILFPLLVQNYCWSLSCLHIGKPLHHCVYPANIFSTNRKVHSPL